ncbi:MAG: NAD(P)H-hydrate epimerase [Planctomycetes bacterium]|nr:NAD(P)H-hydrate epimerase [Planctomycetota bacterium]
MNPPTLTRAQVRELDRRASEEYGIPGMLLMENAGRGVVDVLMALGISGPGGLVVVCCGKGNNGGDGFVIARHLDLRGEKVRVLLFAAADDLTGDAATNFQILSKTGVRIEAFGTDVAAEVLDESLAGADWIVDALLGTGAHGDPRPPLDVVIAAINDQPARKLAVDVPSGLDCDTGQAGGPTIIAAHTCTFVAPKPGFFVPGAAQYTGQLHVCDIGAPRKLVEELLAE